MDEILMDYENLWGKSGRRLGGNLENLGSVDGNGQKNGEIFSTNK